MLPHLGKEQQLQVERIEGLRVAKALLLPSPHWNGGHDDVKRQLATELP